MSFKSGWLWLVLALSIGGCSSKGTIADLQDDDSETDKALNFKNLDHQQVRDEYKELLDLVDDQ
jgi:hypothetical protein